MYNYKIFNSLVYDEEGNSYITYGIQASDTSGNIIMSVPDIFFDKQAASALVEKCNSEQLSIEHLEDIISDAITEQYLI